MAKLKSRQHQIPGGFKFRVPEVRWQSAPFASFDSIVNSVFALLRANPGIAAANGWPTDRNGIADLVDQFNTGLCEQMGWKDYITGTEGPPPPKPPAPGLMERLKSVAGAVKKINQGLGTLLEWERSGLPPVSDDLANWRASICVQCPANGRAPLSAWFTQPASEMIKTQMARLHQLELKTFHDEKLGVCEKCLCPLKLKVFVPTDLVKKHLTPELASELPKPCWMLQ